MKASTPTTNSPGDNSLDSPRFKEIELKIKAVIRYSLKRTAEEGEKYAKEVEKEKSLKMPKTNDCKAFSFKDFRPLDFGNLRKTCGMNDREYFNSIGHTKFEWKTMNGKSGSLFAVTEDKKLLIKTVTKDESKTIRNVILPLLMEYIKNEPNTLIVPVFGLHKFTLDGSDFRFVVMKYLFQAPTATTSSVSSVSSPTTANSGAKLQDPNVGFEMNKIYDLKGSTTDRIAKEGENIKKDLDLINENMKFHIGQDLSIEMLFQLKKDVNFFTSCEVMDYSLITGIVAPKEGTLEAIQNHIKSNNEKGRDKFQIITNTKNSQEFYYFGFIDYFTKYGLRKKAANNIKSMKNDSSTISTVPPSSYSDRFMQFIFKVFD
ncbi:phosphatidylinositol-4-phosphate 5-kinase [Naegleria gruberi]|uniref:Phosphatidylinositol-4-phosphate 5-kinase n=1 Tax=Naegleria gruberi TaxID=5762 RepID=D2V6J4_NAEGR|nr:phosphatidylinositol-4-phosphate 5-kinase [Naegleria gruberi]EFC47586.1 phosphatidylinositol-4-phosphate 5-kinase [Naegleria gruberi]|eukprot:XP_002680330.1 phosphatidylinositol-4-phosphate 5-kinase [Naegleria gruberi strain NEG-M]